MIARRVVLACALLAAGSAASGEGAGDPPYKVEGNKVDEATLKGWKAWRALACDRCHGKDQEGMVGPSLVEALKRLTKEEFKSTVLNGVLEKGMPRHANSKIAAENIDNLYAYLKGRSDGAIPPGRLEQIP